MVKTPAGCKKGGRSAVAASSSDTLFTSYKFQNTGVPLVKSVFGTVTVTVTVINNNTKNLSLSYYFLTPRVIHIAGRTDDSQLTFMPPVPPPPEIAPFSETIEPYSEPYWGVLNQ